MYLFKEGKNLPESKSKKYGFVVGGKRIQITAKTEQLALKRLVLNQWELIEKSGSIKLLGEIESVYK